MDKKDWYKRFQKEKCYAIDNDRFKEKTYVFSPFPKANLHGFQDGQVRSLICGDILARYLRMQNNNVLFPTGFNSLSLSSFLESKKVSNSLDDTISDVFRNQMERLGIGINDQKCIDMRHHEYLALLQNAFIELYEREYIKYKMASPYYDKENNKIYDYMNSPSDLPRSSVKCFVLDIAALIPQIVGDIQALNTDDETKNILLSGLNPRRVMSFEMSVSNGSTLDVTMENPEFMGGISFILLNPEYIDIHDYISHDEYGSVMRYMMDGEALYVYTGLTARNPLTSFDIPVFISRLHQTGVYLGIPSADDEDRMLVENEGFDMVEVLSDGFLVESDLLDGLEPVEARERIFSAFTEAEIAKESFIYGNGEIILSSLDHFGALFPFLEDKGELFSLKEYLPYAFSSQFRPVLGENVMVPGATMTGTMNSLFTSGMAPILSIIYDEIGSIESIFSEDTKDLYETWLPMECIYATKSSLYSNVLMPLIFYNIIKKEVGYTLPSIFKRVVCLSETLDIRHRVIKRSNNNLMDMDRLIDGNGSDAIRYLYAEAEYNQEHLLDPYRLEDINSYISRIRKAIEGSIIGKVPSLEYYFKSLPNEVSDYLEKSDIPGYIRCIKEFTERILFREIISESQALDFLRVIYPIMPYLAEDLYQKVFQGKYSLVNVGWPN